MNLREFDYELPAELIAQRPAERRDASRLLVLDPTSGDLDHRRFFELPELLTEGDLLVLNDTRVVPARLFGRKPTGGAVEVLLLEPAPSRGDRASWRALLRSSRSPAAGGTIDFGAGLRAAVESREGDTWTLTFDRSGAELDAVLERIGRVPLPPYVERSAGEESALDRERYQTVFARRPGAVAAPTAGLHFTEELLDRLVARGVRRAYLTLHVGPGTFLPVRTEDPREHAMHGERFELPAAVGDAIDETRDRGGRVVAVGTTVVRALEASAARDGRVESRSGTCTLFILPGYRFRVVDVLLTNFHLPRTTLLMLVCAFAGRGPILAAYREAIREGYRFYSYGDAMLVRPR